MAPEKASGLFASGTASGAAAKLPQQMEQLRRKIEVIDREIDRLVYALYGRTEAEIRIVEEVGG